MSDFKIGAPPPPSFQPGIKPVSGALSEINSPSAKVDFGELIKSSLDSVNDTQKSAANLATQFELGNPNVDLVRVMVEMQKSRVSFEAVSQVRNKFVEAYREVMSMQV